MASCAWGRGVQRVQRPLVVRARTCPWTRSPARHLRPTRSKRLPGRSTSVTCHVVAFRRPIGSSKRSGPLEARAVAGKRSAPSAAAPRPSAWRRVRSIGALQHRLAAIGATAPPASVLATKMRMSVSNVRAVRRAVLLLALALAGCGATEHTSGPRVVATTTQLADIARNVAPEADVTSILEPNTDPHEYEVRPRDVKALAKADVILRSGGEADAWLGQALDAAGVDPDKVVDAGRVAGLEGDDPHWWQDPRRAERVAAAVGRAIPGADADPYVARLQRLDSEVARCIGAVPGAQRKLVTSHDALGYFARRYGIAVLGTVIPSRSTSAEPSARTVTKLVTTIRQAGVRAVFAESSVNPKVESALAREAGARVGRALWADSLGPAGSDGATYIGSIEANTRALVEGFTGGPAGCRLDA